MERAGIGNRQCSASYKIRPITREIRELLSLRFREHISSDTVVEPWLGISTNDARRMKHPWDPWIENRYPLIEAGMSRRDYIDWW